MSCTAGLLHKSIQTALSKHEKHLGRYSVIISTKNI